MDIEVRAKVIDLDSSGCGHVVAENQSCFTVPFVLPGEHISFKAKKTRRKILIDDLHLLTQSSERIKAVCAHFGICGGCTLQHMNKELYKEFKIAKVVRALRESDVNCKDIKPLITLDASQRWRANFEGIKMPNEFRLGFHKRQTHHIVDIQECHTVSPHLFNVIKVFKPILAQVLDHYQKVQIFALDTQQGADICFDIQGKSELSESDILKLQNFANKNGLARLIFRYRKTRNIIYQSTIPTITIDEVPLPVRAVDFLQSGPQAQETLISLVLDCLSVIKPLRVADLFSGLGTFSIPLSRLAKVDAFEFDSHACDVLNDVAQSSMRPINVAKRNLFDSPLTVGEINLYDALIIDPPRAGAENQCIEISKSKVAHVVYVSCHVESLARDAKILCEGGYKLVQITPVDQFPYTAHIECVAYFKYEKN